MTRDFRWPLSARPKPPPGMPIEEARLAGLVPPAGWRPPRPPRLVDVARTVTVAARLIGGFVLVATGPRKGPIPNSSTADGLTRVQRSLLAALEQLGVTLEILHQERVPDGGGFIFMWNQTSHLDHLLLPPAIPRPFFSIFNNEIRATPLYGRYLARAGHLWVDRTDEAQWRPQIGVAAARIRAGECLLVSPEGTRSWDGRLLPMKRGAFLAARLSQRPIICVTVIGAHRRLPRGSMIVRPGPVRIVFSEPIPVTPNTEPQLERLVADTFEALIAA